MTVWVDDVRHSFGRMIMCHMWSDDLDELLAMAERIGVKAKWLQQPPKASWVHFDVSLGAKKQALAAGAVLTDRFGPLEHVARQRGDEVTLERIRAARLLRLKEQEGLRLAMPETGQEKDEQSKTAPGAKASREKTQEPVENAQFSLFHMP